MGRQNFVGHAGGPEQGDPTLRLLSVLESRTATPEQKAQAESLLVAYFNLHPQDQPQINQVARMHNMLVTGKNVLYDMGGGNWQPIAQSNGQPFDTGDNLGPTLDPRALKNQSFRAALTSTQQATDAARQMLTAHGPAPGNMVGTSVTQPSARSNPTDPQLAAALVAGKDISGNATGAGNSTLPGGAGSTPGGLGGATAPGNTFFGNQSGTALNDLNANPKGAWNLYLAQGGPGQGSVANAGVAGYGQDDFNSAFALAPYLGGPSSPTNALQFTNDVMNYSNKPGQYLDPSKVFNAAMQNISGRPAAEQVQGVTDLENAMQAYMDPTNYAAFQDRINQVLGQYQAMYGANPNQDMTGVLLKMVQQAAGF